MHILYRKNQILNLYHVRQVTPLWTGWGEFEFFYFLFILFPALIYVNKQREITKFHLLRRYGSCLAFYLLHHYVKVTV